jgi:hypothetical protein
MVDVPVTVITKLVAPGDPTDSVTPASVAVTVDAAKNEVG